MYAHDAAVAELAIPIGVVASTHWIVDSRTHIGALIWLVDVALRWITFTTFSDISQTIF